MDYAQTVHFRSIDMTLDRVTQVYQRLNPEVDTTKIIIVGGTNGKGSSVAMLESIYTQAGYSTTAFTSPHLIHFNERYRHNGNNLDDKTLINSFEKIEQLRRETALTYFEFATLVAIDCLLQCKPDVMIMETGMGGRLDSVNILNPDCVLLTHIALDHTQWLGETREEIGFEKAGLFRAKIPAVCGDLSAPQSLLQHADKLGTDLKLIRRDYDHAIAKSGWDWHGHGDDYLQFKDLPLPNIVGHGQIKNAAGVLMALHCLNDVLPVTEKSIRKGLTGAVIQGRLEQISYQGHSVILDVAHNADAVSILNDFLTLNPVEGKTIAVLGMLEDKDIQQVIRLICLNIDQWELASLNEPRGANAEQISAQLLQVERAVKYNCNASPTIAFEAAIADTGPNDRVVVFGSFHTVGEVLAHLQR